MSCFIIWTNTPNNNELINSVDKTKNEQLLKLRKELQYLYYKKEQLQVELLSEISGKGGTRMYGVGPVAHQLRHNIDEIQVQIMQTRKEIDEISK